MVIVLPGRRLVKLAARCFNDIGAYRFKVSSEIRALISSKLASSVSVSCTFASDFIDTVQGPCKSKADRSLCVGIRIDHAAADQLTC